MKKNKTILSAGIRSQQDVVLVRQRARQVAQALGFSVQEQTRIATAVSEIARNAFEYGGGGRAEFLLDEQPPATLLVRVSDRGPGIAELDAVLEGRPSTSNGLGLGIVGARRLMDRFEITTDSKTGTVVLMGKVLPRQNGLVAEGIEKIAEKIARDLPRDPFSEIQQQNRELLSTLEELRERQAELLELNLELEDTNRGVVALYTELNEKADSLARANELKTAFLSNMSHEFRTPLNAILSLSALLLDRVDGDLTPEQHKQVSFIQQSAQGLSDLVNDLLDMAKVEAGKVSVHPSEFQVESLFGALRGMLKPLLAPNSAINLVFEELPGLPVLYTDEGKVSQILRNFISNALKFTEQGEVRVTARPGPAASATVVFSVADTGIGILFEDQERIFEEYTQIDSPLQQRTKGTGLGLPLSRQLAQLLKGRVWVGSSPGRGSTFYLEIPVCYDSERDLAAADCDCNPAGPFVLAIEDNLETLLLYQKYLLGTSYSLHPAPTLKEAQRVLDNARPAVVLLDVLLGDENTWGFLKQIKEDEATRTIPVLVATVVDNHQKAVALGADGFCVKPIEREWLLQMLRTFSHESG
ncbi:ATP-binding protein [Gloeobacter kilaueensis]|uniref:histidine kinase n=1 Tax=Gloeobacter kilaueensis (strain ATCC BAA-2537 / CCAP 1431/1 / ULC 316 / JS1) TaxID=1183438 RepID=U5QES6_GLOK1|nr:ATP-binding protein [Gloeobacter kilaueensis]AGY57348.1 multi-sensor hybrid histidine kinase [Gloeobacter kilaueensis JS1]